MEGKDLSYAICNFLIFLWYINVFQATIISRNLYCKEKKIIPCWSCWIFILFPSWMVAWAHIKTWSLFSNGLCSINFGAREINWWYISHSNNLSMIIYSINTVDDNHKDYHVYFVYLFPYFVDDDDNMMSLFLYGLCVWVSLPLLSGLQHHLLISQFGLWMLFLSMGRIHCYLSLTEGLLEFTMIGAKLLIHTPGLMIFYIAVSSLGTLHTGSMASWTAYIDPFLSSRVH